MHYTERQKMVAQYIAKGRKATEKENKKGDCPCFVCGQPLFTKEELYAHFPKWMRHVKRKGSTHPYAPTYEHILQRSKGGTDALANFSVSHAKCNQHRENSSATISAPPLSAYDLTLMNLDA